MDKDARIDKLRETHLQYLRFYFEAEHRDLHLFRTFVDSWFAYRRRNGFVKKRTLSVQWFNKDDLVKERLKPAILSMHFISTAAWVIAHAAFIKGLPASVSRMASRAPIAWRRPVSMTDRMLA